MSAGGRLAAEAGFGGSGLEAFVAVGWVLLAVLVATGFLAAAEVGGLLTSRMEKQGDCLAF